MAIAPYFQRAATAANQVLKDYTYNGLVKLLEKQRVGLQIDSAAAKSAEGLAAADMVVRLLARFYPKIAVIAADAGANATAASLRELALAINPNIDVADKSAGVTHLLVIGKSPAGAVKKGGLVAYVGSSNWTARLSWNGPVGCGTTKNPFAAGVAACLGVANVFRNVFFKQLENAELDGEVKFSLLTLAKAAGVKAGTYQIPAIGTAYLVGAGAIGNGALWALSRAGVTGELNVIDPQQLELSNLQRYVMPVMDDLEKSKTVLAEKWLKGAKGLKVIGQKNTWDDFVRPSEDWNFERVLVALDSAEGRISVQASLPKWVANAYTLGAGLGVSRHFFVGESACLACLYLPDGAVKNEDELIASAIGLEVNPLLPEFLDLRRRLHHNLPCDRDFLTRISTRKNIDLENLLPFENRTVRDLYQTGVCGGQILGINVDGNERNAEVPMAFQSAMAGVLLAAELVLNASDARAATFPTVTRIDLNRPLPSGVSVMRAKDAGERCLCQDADYKAVFSQKYDTPA